MQWIALIFGVFIIIMYFLVGWPIMEGGVAVSNTSATSGNYTGWTETVNLLPWAIFVIMLFIVAAGWWYGRKS